MRVVPLMRSPGDVILEFPPGESIGTVLPQPAMTHIAIQEQSWEAPRDWMEKVATTNIARETA